MTVASDVVELDAVRRFNRFYTRRLGLLNEVLLDSGFTLTEARVLFELADRGEATATDLRTDLGLDAGYLSRMLKAFERKRLVTKTRSEEDGRQSLLALSAEGQRTFRPMEAASRAQIADMLSALDAGRRRRVVGAMASIERLLSGKAEAEVTLRPHGVGDIGHIASRQALIYHRDHGWDQSYEALAAEILAGFVRTYDPERERGWIAERDGEIVGSVFCMKKSDEVAKLRLLYVEPSAQGLGLGRRLVDECIGFARAKGYRTLTLWTNDVLVAARKIYVATGFQLVEEEKHHSFGADLVGQTWELKL